MEKHAGMVKNIDDNVGLLLATLAKEGVLDQTIILFLSDNGAETFSNYQQQYRWIWMNLCNAPFRLCKHYAHEGGIATPLIVRWPGVVPAGTINRRQVGHVMDLLPTLLDAVGGQFPKANLGLATIPPAGQSLLAAWKNPEQAAPRTLFWEHGGNEAVRDGKWKLVRPYNLQFLDPFYDRAQQARLERAGGWKLSDMEADRAELHNLAAQMPDKVAELEAKFAAWAKSVGVADRGKRDPH